MLSKNKKIRKAVIPAAGLGTRFLPATKAIPKEMIPIIDKPMIQYIVEECIESGIEEIIFITARGKESIADHFDHSFEVEHHLLSKGKKDLYEQTVHVSTMTKVISIRQKTPLGLGHAVLCAKPVVQDEPFAVLLGDDLIISDKKPCIKQLIEQFEQYQKSVIGIMEVPQKEVSKYGIIDGSKIGENLYSVKGMVEKPSPEKSPSRLACPGRYILTPEIFELLESSKPGVSGEIQLTDSLDALAKMNQLNAFIFEGRRYDTGDKLGYLEATIHFALKRPELREGLLKIIKEL